MEQPAPAKNETSSRDAAWARPFGRVKTSGISAEAINLNVDGKQLTGPLQGFGQMWQKTYRVRLTGSDVTPAEVVQAWRENFGSFWPEGNRFYAPLTRIEPGEVAVLNLTGPANMQLSTGVVVIYADEQSFTFMTPEGHMFAGWNTFSAYEEDGCTVVQNHVLVRANDPLWEIIMRLSGARKEDEFWHATLLNIARHFGVNGQVVQETICVDPKVQWSQARNIWHNAGIRSGLYMFTLPFRWIRRQVSR